MSALRLTDGERVAWVDSKNPLLRLGRSKSNDVVIQHDTVADFHAELLFRGLGTILRTVGRSRIHFEDGTVDAPVVLGPKRNQFRLGDVLISVHRPSLVSLIDVVTPKGRVVERIDSLERGVWRYRTDSQAEVVQAPILNQFGQQGGPHLSRTTKGPEAYRLESAPSGIAISWLLRRDRINLDRKSVV